ncbi:MAG: carbamate kinase [Planctomycetota bacterium]
MPRLDSVDKSKPNRNKIGARLVVVALGGNALLQSGEKGTIQEQERHAVQTCQYLVPLLKNDYHLVITHGNGPQVGNILLQNEEASKIVPAMPLDVCVADSEGSIGYILQQAILNELRRHDIRRYVVTMITQVVVDKNDPAFSNPTKPIGPFFNKEKAEALKQERQWCLLEDSGRGYRRIVPSPKPLKIIQRLMIKELVRSGHIVIAVGGGGIPIWKNAENDYEGIEAVIDKDLASSVLAQEIKADLFLILTAVPQVYLNYGKPNRKPIPKMSLTEAKKYLAEGHFAVGSMQPKIEAAVSYLEKINGKVLITSAEKLMPALEGNDGTLIYSDVKRKVEEDNLLIDF